MVDKLGPYVSSGTRTMGGTALTVICGFRPSYVRLYNITAKSTVDWVPAEGDAKCWVDKDTGSGTEDMSEVTTNGITGVFNGFIIGTDSKINNNNDVVYWVAFRS